MEEVDSIIVRQLKEADCPLDEDKTTIKDLDANEVIVCAARCLSIIDGGVDEQLASVGTSNLNMATKYKVATHLAEKCLQLGYKGGDLGYQTFLYSAETEIRKLFLFLIDKLPKDEEHHSTSPSKTAGREGNVVTRLRRSNVSTTWLPPMYPLENLRSEQDDIRTQNVSGVLNAKSILGNKMAPSRRKYFDNYAIINLDVSTLISWNSLQLHLPATTARQQHVVIENLVEVNSPETSSAVSSSTREEVSLQTTVQEESEDKETYEQRMLSIIGDLQSEVDALKTNEAQMSDRCKKLAQQVIQMEAISKSERESLIEMRSRDKTMDDLKSAVEKQESELQTMSEQWTEMENDYKARIESIRTQIELNASQASAAQRDLDEIKKLIVSKSREMKEKQDYANELNEKMPEQSPPGRSSYTKRILEIVNNVKKQKDETRKVLTETRALQKEINNLQGKVQRAFTVTDETIFRDAKSSEWHRKCYKLLASMRENCDTIMDGIDETGTIRREVIKLEELMEKEQTKMVDSNLVRIQADLKQITIENQKLQNMANALAKQQL